jgi:hypothetical protein
MWSQVKYCRRYASALLLVDLRLLTLATGLSVHMNQVHKETLTSVDNSLPNRQGPEVEVFGTEGIPDDIRQLSTGLRRATLPQVQAKADKPRSLSLNHLQI